jgi:hypothetical protein
MMAIGPHHAHHARELSAVLGADQLADVVAALAKLSEALDAMDLSD